MTIFPHKAKALRVSQALGNFYVAVLPAELLLEVCFSDQARTTNTTETGYGLTGTQRIVKTERLSDIANYINRSDSSFPNSIIIAANVDFESGSIEDDGDARWDITADHECGIYELTIPTSRKFAAVIDGQHRLFAFQGANAERLNTDLICSIFLDLPMPFQAQIFATINSNQQPVGKSLTYELFGYNVAEESEEFWSPDKLAVLLARKLNFEPDSPLQGRILIAPIHDIPDEAPRGDWRVSMATVVEGIAKLISTNPKRDVNKLLTPRRNKRSVLREIEPKDRSVLREQYVEGNDQLIYLLIRNYLNAVNDTLWRNAAPTSFIVKTVGIQALFDILRKLAVNAIEGKDISVSYFSAVLAPAEAIDFSGVDFRNASGSGRTAIRRAIEVALRIG